MFFTIYIQIFNIAAIDLRMITHEKRQFSNILRRIAISHKSKCVDRRGYNKDCLFNLVMKH